MESMAAPLIITVTAGVTVGAVINAFQAEISAFLKACVKSLKNLIVTEVIIERGKAGSEMLEHYLTDYVSKRMQATATSLTLDDKLQYQLEDTWSFEVNHRGTTVHISKTKETIRIYAYFANIGVVKDFVNTKIIATYAAVNAPERALFIYISEGAKWKPIIPRRPRNITLTKSMQAMHDDVAEFLQSEQKNKAAGVAHRRGYLVVGPPRTGKSMIVEKLAIDFGMTPHLANFNTNDATDTTLLSLFANVPIQSIIVIDEFEKQYAGMRNNKTINITDGGILNAIDGIQRLSHGTIVVIIANSIDGVPAELKECLLQPGRIDVQFKFLEPVSGKAVE